MVARSVWMIEQGVCQRGHAWISENLGTYPSGASYCKPCAAARKRAARAKNPEHLRDYDKARYAANPLKKRWSAWKQSSKVRAERFGVAYFEVSFREWSRIRNSPCARQGADCSGEVYPDHIVPLGRGGSHSVGNLQPLCCTHNSSKQDQLEMEVRLARW